MINTKAAQQVLYKKIIANDTKTWLPVKWSVWSVRQFKNNPIVTIESANQAPYDDSTQSSTSYYDNMYAHEKFFMKDTERLDYFKKYLIFNSYE